MFTPLQSQRLNEYLETVERIFPEFAAIKDVDLDVVQEYYNASFWGYLVLHSWAGAMHLALSRDGTYTPKDYGVQAEEIASIVPDAPDGIVAEIGCGRGFNIARVAQCQPTRQCKGLDVNSRHIGFARKKFAPIKNLGFELSDFHTLRTLQDGTVGVLCAVETLTHAIDLESVLSTARRVAKLGSPFIVFDGYRKDTPIMGDLERAVILVERAMAVPRFKTEQEFCDMARTCGWRVISVRDRTEEVMPNLLRLSDWTRIYFWSSSVAKCIKRYVPKALARNLAATLLMPITFSEGAHRYLNITLEAV